MLNVIVGMAQMTSGFFIAAVFGLPVFGMYIANGGAVTMVNGLRDLES